MNSFITIANYIGDNFENSKAGNERVVVARLDDAIFFFNEDTKKPFENYVEDLKGITFQKGMGSVYDKTQRIVTLSEYIANKLSQPLDTIKRTALLCKADLTTKLVFEFTELQGFIGSDYAFNAGENPKVVKGIKEHYYPLGADS
jgi:glycyl-tRNA synthetase beta chain